MAPVPEVFPFAPLDDRWSYPAWIRGLRRSNGVYVFRDRESGEIVYVGESHSDRLYATLTRHFQRWTDAFDTAGVTYYRDEVDIAVIVVPGEHANYLQNELICALIPRDNRLQCAQLFGLDDEENDDDQADEESGDREYEYGDIDYGAYYDPGRIDDDQVDDDQAGDVYEFELTSKEPPPGYDYDIPLLLEGIAYEFPDDGLQDDGEANDKSGKANDIPF